MSSDEIMKTYGLSSTQAYKAKQRGFIVKNYMKKQVCPGLQNVGNNVLG
jgi:hypothetical protein